MPKALTTEEFLRRSLGVWGGRWDYSESAYTGAKNRVIVICRLHGPFSQIPYEHLQGRNGCSGCRALERTTTQEEFLVKARKVWQGRWDYSQMKYSGWDSTIEVICEDHGVFQQKAINHLQGYMGCYLCTRKGKNLIEFKDKSKKVWGGRWDYTQTMFKGTNSKIVLTCPDHGSFEQVASSHQKGLTGCRDCSGKAYDTQSFIQRALEVWSDRWDYSRVIYIYSKSHVNIVCPKHGNFEQSPDSHLTGYVGCIPCQNTQTSKGEQGVLDFLRSEGGTNLQHRVRGALSNPRIELDIYVPEKKVAIEFNGVYWHSSKFKDKDAHHTKFKMAEEAEIKLVQVWEDDWNLRRPIVEEHLKQVLGVSTLPKIAARKTKVVEVPYSVAKDFLNANHIQGAAGAAFHLSLQYEGDVVALASFKRRSDGDLELVRYATSATVQGGHSKLVTYVERNYTYNQLVTFADLTFGSGELYRKTGWVEDKFLSPDYQYLVGGRRVHKFNYRLKRFREDPDLQYVEGMSESQLSELNGLLRVYDAGKIRFVKKHPNDDTI